MSYSYTHLNTVAERIEKLRQRKDLRCFEFEFNYDEYVAFYTKAPTESPNLHSIFRSHGADWHEVDDDKSIDLFYHHIGEMYASQESNE